jgi:hypothetical protein
MGHLRKIFTLCIVGAVVTVCLGGCMPGIFKSKGAKAVEAILAHLSDKYDDSFTYIRPCDGGLSTLNKQIYAKAEKFPDA